MLVHLAGRKTTVAIDYREIAPADTPRDVFLDEAGNFSPSRSQSSGLAVGVPGTVAGFALAHRKYGSGKFTLAELVAPSIPLARDGIDVDEDLADSLPFIARRLARYASSRAIFLKGGDRPLVHGDRLVQTDLARTLERIAANGERGFYEGETAQKIIAAVRAHGGRMTLEDMRMVLNARCRIEGFIVSDHMQLWPQAIGELRTTVRRAASSGAPVLPKDLRLRQRHFSPC